MKGSRAKGRGGSEKLFWFYAQLARRFSLRLCLVRRRGGRSYAPTSIMVLMALIIHLFHVEKPFVAFLRVWQRAFFPRRFLC